MRPEIVLAVLETLAGYAPDVSEAELEEIRGVLNGGRLTLAALTSFRADYKGPKGERYSDPRIWHMHCAVCGASLEARRQTTNARFPQRVELNNIEVTVPQDDGRIKTFNRVVETPLPRRAGTYERTVNKRPPFVILNASSRSGGECDWAMNDGVRVCQSCWNKAAP